MTRVRLARACWTLVPTLVFGGGQPAVYDACERLVDAYAREVLGFEEFVVEWAWSQDWRRPSEAGIRRPDCPRDEYVVRLRPTYDQCHMAHYGRIPDYVVDGYWTGNCRGKKRKD